MTRDNRNRKPLEYRLVPGDPASAAARDKFNPHMANEVRTCCGCHRSWEVPCSPAKLDPPFSCGKPECNQVMRREKGLDNG
jgi:hypothetical protein